MFEKLANAVMFQVDSTARTWLTTYELPWFQCGQTIMAEVNVVLRNEAGIIGELVQADCRDEIVVQH